MGYWKSSRETDPQNRHAVYGIFRQDDAFCIMAVRETRAGLCLDGNIPSHPDAFQIPYEEVELEPHYSPRDTHLKALSRQEAMEYCRVRQHQLDHGEISAERIENETKAVYEAQIRACTMLYTQSRNVTIPMFPAFPQSDGDERLNGRHGYGGHELHQSRRIEPRCIQVSPGGDERQLDRLQSVAAVERSGASARREIARAEAIQGRHHYNTNGRIPFHKPEDIQQLNRGWARQETPRMKSGSDVKMYDGHKYERKATGPFMGKLVSQGTIVAIDGDDYVEYHVLTKPSFF
ncbi:hypothetical protein MGU_11385 [Metarhizium guizhouense ARSEF 977]|uniref:Uncharacterized protein n=1 Tax=Metarhizium guizhouense (strain ARSEF 977) TaxID=1276136 RepID=A0A0B4GFI8_METGA|nr:hypothetical protein MGU_11385 [Metarhizium guizhouense ARSEF 977]